VSAPHDDKVVYISADAKRRATLLQRQETLRLIREDLAVAAQLLAQLQEPPQGLVGHLREDAL
jgi:predicted nucleic acid-binding Zn ribbon protein